MEKRKMESLSVVILIVVSFVVVFGSEDASAGALKDDEFYAIASTQNAIYVAGYTTSFGAGGQDVIVQKYNLNSWLAWTYLWGGSLNDVAYSLCVQTISPYLLDSIYITGTTNSYSVNQHYDVFVLKLDENGNLCNEFGNGFGYVLWGCQMDDAGYGITANWFWDTNIYVTGATCNFGYNAFILKYDVLGNNLWADKPWGAVIWDGFLAGDCGNSIACDDNAESGCDRVYVTGHTDPNGNGTFDGLMLCYDDNGLPVTQGNFNNGFFTYGTEHCDISRSLYYESANDWLITVGSSNYWGYWDLFYYKCDASIAGPGTMYIWYQNCPGDTTYDGYSVTYDGTNVWITGDASSAIIAVDLFVAQCDLSGDPNNGWPVTYDFGYVFAYGRALTFQTEIFVAGAITDSTIGWSGGVGTCVVKISHVDGAIMNGWPMFWSERFDDFAMAIQVTDTAIYFAGYTYGYGTLGKCDAFVAKYTLNGLLFWWKTWGGPGSNDRAYAIGVTDTAVFIAGSTEVDNPNDRYDFFIMKYDLDGNPQNFGGGNNGYISNIDQNDEIFGMDIENNLIYCTGYWQQATKDILLVDADFNGNQVRTSPSKYNIPPDADEEAYSIAVDGEYAFCAGYTFSRNAPNGGGGDALLVRYDLQPSKRLPQGNPNIPPFSNYLYGLQLFDCAYSVSIDDNYFYWAGSIRSTEPVFPPPTYDNSFVQKRAKDGTLQWTKCNTDNWNDIAYSVKVKEDYIYVTGYEEKHGAGLQDVYLRKYDLVGNTMWETYPDDPPYTGMILWGGDGMDIGRAIAVTDNIYVAGWTTSYGPPGGTNGLILKHSMDGEFSYYELWS